MATASSDLGHEASSGNIQNVANSSNKFALQTFSNPVSVKLEENIFLLWRQQVIFTTVQGFKLQKYLVGEQFAPHKFATPEDEENGKMSEDYLN